MAKANRSANNLKNFLPYIFSLVILVGFIIYLYQNFEQYRQLLQLSLNSIFVLIGLSLLLLAGQGLINYFLYRALNASVSLNESIGLSTINALANQLPIAGGIIAKGVYLKKKHQLTYTHYLSATLALYTGFVAVNGFIGLIILLYLALSSGILPPLILIIGFSGLTASILLLWIPTNIPFLPDRWQKKLIVLMEGWQILSQNPILLVQLIGIQMTLVLVVAGRLWVSFHILSQDISFPHCILLSAATILTRLISIAPGGLGIREAIVAGVAATFGFDAGISMVAVGLERLVATLVVIILGTTYTYILSYDLVNRQPAASNSSEFKNRV